MMSSRVYKKLSPNDAGETKSHQAGMLVPKRPELLSFFPKLIEGTLNPRCHLIFEDAAGDKWKFAFIYYNNKLFEGTRNEYRLTHMTTYIKTHGLASGDEIELIRNGDGTYQVGHRRKNDVDQSSANVLILGSGWKIIQLT